MSQAYQAASGHPSSFNTGGEFYSLAQLTSLQNQTCPGPFSRAEDNKLEWSVTIFSSLTLQSKVVTSKMLSG